MTKLVSGKQSISYRNYRRARDRALVRLSHAYPDTYKQLLEIERTFDEQEGKKWIGIDGLSNLTVGTHTRANGADYLGTYTVNAQSEQSDNGGEA
jgi:hypothetical protein